MPTVFVLDVDNTIVPYQPTKRLFQHVFMQTPALKYILTVKVMIFFLTYFWWLPGVVYLQRMWLLTLFSRVDISVLEAAAEKVADEALAHYHSNFGQKLSALFKEGDKIIFLSHCPNVVVSKLSRAIQAEDFFSLEVHDYLKKPKCLKNFNKAQIIKTIQRNNKGFNVTFFADDLIDLRALRQSDTPILVNATPFTKQVASFLLRRATLWV